VEAGWTSRLGFGPLMWAACYQAETVIMFLSSSWLGPIN